MIGLSTGNVQKSILRFLLSIILAFPLSGVAVALVGLAREPSFLFENPSAALLEFFYVSISFGLSTPMKSLGILKPGGDVPDMNMYPYIIPAACIIFFLISKGWRWLKPR